MRKADAEFRNNLAPLPRRIGYVGEARKKIAARIARRDADVAVRANPRRGSFASKELLAMTIQTGRMLGKIRHVGKRSLGFPRLLPVLRRKRVARAARQLLFLDVSAMRETRVIDARFCRNLQFLSIAIFLRLGAETRGGRCRNRPIADEEEKNNQPKICLEG